MTQLLSRSQLSSEDFGEGLSDSVLPGLSISKCFLKRRLVAKLVTFVSIAGARDGARLTCRPSLGFPWLPGLLKPSSPTTSSSLHPRVRPGDPRLCPVRGLFPPGWRQPWSFALSCRRRGECQRPGWSRLPSLPSRSLVVRVGASWRPPGRARGRKLTENGVLGEESGPSGALDPGGILALGTASGGQENREAPWS